MHAPALLLLPSPPGILLPVLGWELLVAAAVLGVGVGVLRLLGLRALDLGTTLCAGVAAWLVLGGWLNLFGLATRVLVWALVVAGCGLLVLFWRELDLPARFVASMRDLWPRSRLGRGCFCVLASFLAVCCISHVAETTWNKYDDTQGYLAFAEKAVALGGLYPEPYSLRRAESGVGAAVFLNQIMLSGPASTLPADFLDGFIGLVALVSVLLAFARRLGVRHGWLLPLLLWLGLSPFGRVNLTAVYLPAAMLLAMLLLIFRREGRMESRKESQPGLASRPAVLFGLLMGAAFSLKSTNLPVSLAWLAILAVAWAVPSRTLRPALGLVAATAVSFGVMLPWAIRHRIDEGTALFPTLGKGFHLSAYPGFPSIPSTTPLAVSLAVAWPGFVLPLLALLCARWLLKSSPGLVTVSFRTALLSFFAATAVTAPLLSVALASEGIYRYQLPVENLCALLLLTVALAVLAAPAGRGSSARALYWTCALLVLWAARAVHAAVEMDFYREPLQAFELARPDLGRDLTFHYETFLTPAGIYDTTARVRRAQQAVPPGAPLYESVEAAYGFDWRRNPVQIADFPGMASPPPGMPLDGTPAAMQQYFLDHGVHYVLLDRTLFERVDYPHFRRSPQVQTPVGKVILPWAGPVIAGDAMMEWTVSNRTRELLLALATPQHVVYDDGRLVVLHL